MTLQPHAICCRAREFALSNDTRSFRVLLYILAGSAVLALLHLTLKWLATHSVKFRELTTPTLRYLLRELYVRALDGGYLHVDIRRSGAYFRVYKTIISHGVVRLTVHVPPNAQELVGPGVVEQALGENGFEGLVARGDVSHGKNGDLVIECGSGIDQATVIVEFLMQRVFHVAPERDCVAYLRDFHLDPRAHPGFDRAPLP